MEFFKAIIITYLLVALLRCILALFSYIRYIDILGDFMISDTYIDFYKNKELGRFCLSSPSRLEPPLLIFYFVLNPRYWTLFTPSDIFNVDPPKWLVEDFGIKTFKELKNAK